MIKTTRKEIIEEFDESGHLITKTTTEETITEDDTSYQTPYFTNIPYNDFMYKTTSAQECHL